MAFIKRSKRNRTPKSSPFTYLILNIKLNSNRRSGTEAYRQVMLDIFNNTIRANIGRGKAAFLRTMFPAEIEEQEFFYGKIAKFTNLENNKWVNINTREEAELEIEKGFYPNLQEAEYVFIPQAHRFALKLSQDFTIKTAQEFFTKALRTVLSSDEDYNVIIQQSQGIYDEIYKAASVEKLSISVSYTNSDDIGDDAAEWLDAQLKESNIKVAQFNFDAGKNDNININTSLIKGGLELAVENGEVEAKIKDSFGKTKSIVTKDHPEKYRSVADSENDLKSVIFNEIMQRYRNNNE